MQLPKHLQIFTNPSLILIGNFGKTNFYIAHEININQIDIIEATKTTQQYSENSTIANNDRRTLNDITNNEEEDRRQYVKILAQKITNIANDHSVNNIQIIMPQELIHRIKNELSDDIKILIIRELDKDLVKTDLNEALTRLAEKPVPIK